MTPATIVPCFKSAKPRFGLARFALLGSLVLWGSQARGEPYRATEPRPARLGIPQDPEPSPSGDGTGRNQTRQLLPTPPEIAWHVEVPGPLRVGPAVAANGDILVASAEHLVALSAEGSSRWRIRLGSAAATAPVIASDGTRLILTTEGILIAVRSDGHLRWRVNLTPFFRAGDLLARLEADSDGGVVVAQGSALWAIDREGQIVARTQVHFPIQQLVRRGHDWLAVGTNGIVSSWRRPQEPQSAGEFPGQVSRVALKSPDTLIAVVNGRQVIELSLRSSRHQLLWEATTPTVIEALAVGTRAEVWTLGADGALRCHSSSMDHGCGLAHVAGSTPVATVPGETDQAIPETGLLVDPAGCAAAVRPNVDLVVLTADGESHLAPGMTCTSPVAISPAGKARVVLTCRSGSVFLATAASASPAPR